MHKVRWNDGLGIFSYATKVSDGLFEILDAFRPVIVFAYRLWRKVAGLQRVDNSWVVAISPTIHDHKAIRD